MSPSRTLVHVLVHDYEWIHLTLGFVGNLLFVVGSVLFLPALERYQTLAVWLFIVGSFLMLLGSLGRVLVSVLEREEAARGGAQ